MSEENQNAMRSVDIAIVGGGMVGLSLACGLGGSGLEVAVVDPASEGPPTGHSGFDPRVSAISPVSERILAGLGAWQCMDKDRLSPYRAMEVWDGEGTGRLHFSAADADAEHLGHIVENSMVVAGLGQVVARHGNVQRLNEALADLEPSDNGRRRITLSGGTRLSARLVVGADGSRSRTRELAGLAVDERDYDHHAIVTTVTTEAALQETAWQRFTEDGPLAFLPLAGSGHQASIVWSTSPDHARELMDCDDEAFRQALGEAFEYRLGAVTEVDARHRIPLTQRHAPSYIADGLALVGDAAHSIHPLAGQGVNLGFLDAATLAEEVLASYRQGLEIGDVRRLRRYQRRRQGDNLKMIGLMAALRHLYGAVPPPLHWLRNRGMSRLDNMAPLKRWLIDQAMGRRGRLPAVAQPPWLSESG